ncbi:MAG: tRNA (adenosine(37)-N6)-threonylcarbamoyltransferase complex dimerization subunit type 1 TsaB [Bacteroidales bacterium]|nr:tRNA (adenosine(37)-N6)-threonylcarbamoyltransferase complex dimerization subunit type 1 TsaB [Candidatus Cryptobacteroides aphodequi]
MSSLKSKHILLIETSTSLCSVALAEGSCAADASVVAYRQSDTPRAHASMTAVFIKEVLDSRSLKATDLDAVALSSGPGSYTGLRVGSSTAKGICFGAGVPLIAVPTLDILVEQAIVDGVLPEGCRTIIPMIDARRMEVYCAQFCTDADGRFTRKGEVAPLVVESGCFADTLAAGPVLFIGDGAAKCSDVIAAPGASFIQCCPRADAMARKAFEALDTKHFEDTAYFEPFYLKEFVATVSKKSLF